MALAMTAHSDSKPGAVAGKPLTGMLHGMAFVGVLAAAMALSSLAHAQTPRSQSQSRPAGETRAQPTAKATGTSSHKARPGSRAKSGSPGQRDLADRIDRRDTAPRSNGVMRFGDTEVRIGGRASFGYGLSGR